LQPKINYLINEYIPNRKNIAKALDTYSAYSPQVQENLHTCIQTLGLPTDANGKYTITDEESLKNCVYAIQERFYTTQASISSSLCFSLRAENALDL
jgi:hypothetical protein